MNRKGNNEKGIALLFTLGILSLLLVLAVAFATSALNQKKLAQNSANVTLARLIAESAVERAIAWGQAYSAVNSTASMGAVLSELRTHETSDPNGNNETFDWLWKLDTFHKDVNWPWPNTTYNPGAPDAIHWEYIYNGLDEDSTANKPDRIIGRIAYVMASTNSRLDPSACVRHTAATPGVPAGTAVNENGANEKRYGQYVHEINIQNLDPINATAFLPTTDVSNLSTTVAAPVGLLPDGTSWGNDVVNTLAALGIADIPANQAKREQWFEWFYICSSADDEKYWIDKGVGHSDDGVMDTDEYYHRFDLTKTGATPRAMADILKAPTIFTDTYPPAKATPEGEGIPWIYYWTDTTGNWTVTNKKNQLAANIKDYLDSDIEATTDDEDAPTYTGNDKTPYINQVVIHFNGKVVKEDSTDYPGTKKYTPTVTMPSIYVETCNMYDTDVTNVTAKVTIGFTYNWVGGTYTFAEKSYDNISIPGTRQSYQSRIEPVAENITPGGGTPTIVDNAADGLGAINSLNITKLEVKLTVHDPGPPAKPKAFADFSYIAPNGSTSFTISPDGSNYDLYVSYEVDDPRQNLNVKDWADPVATSGSSPFAAPTADSKNLVCKPDHSATSTTPDDPAGSTYDLEAGAAEPWNVSTAFIRNGPMQSPWELGFIHRACKWQTLNIHKYNSTVGAKKDTGGSAYSDGDANILDQIKMTAETTTRGKVNIRGVAGDVAKALIYGMRCGVPLPNNGADGVAGNADDNDAAPPPIADTNWTETTFYGSTLLDKTKAAEVAILAGAISGNNSLTRARVANATGLSDGNGSAGKINQNTDAKKEEIIGKFINLTKSEIPSSDDLRLIVIAQTIKDVGGPLGTDIIISKDLNFDGSIADPYLDLAINNHYNLGYLFDADLNGVANDTSAPIARIPHVYEKNTHCQLGKYDPGIDEITGQQKILVRLKYDSTAPAGSKLKIIKYEYVE